MSDISHLDKEEQLTVMEEWFRERYEDPAQRTPHDEGEYVYIWGGPYDAHDVLSEVFSSEVPDEVIEGLSQSLSQENPEWAPVSSEDDYDHSLFDAVNENKEALKTFNEGIENINALLSQFSKLTNTEMVYALLFANVVTTLETYLSDAFINRVLVDQNLLRKFLETTPEFKKRSIAFSEVLSHAEKVPEECTRYLLDVVWHNLEKVGAMYHHALGIEFRSSIKDVSQAISIRHHIVHRNGKKKDGSKVIIGSGELSQLIKDTTTLVSKIETQFNEKK